MSVLIPGTFRKKAISIQAIQFVGTNTLACIRFCPTAFEKGVGGNLRFVIPTLEGEMTVSFGDWIIRGVEGEFYPCKPSIFEKLYEKEE